MAQENDSPVVEFRIDRVPKKTDWKEVGGGDRDKMESATFRAGTKGPSYQPENSETNRHSEQDGRILKGR